MRLSPADSDSPIRTFYLRLAEEQEAEAWAQTIREARFDGVREERDALRSAKAVMTEQVVWWDVPPNLIHRFFSLLFYDHLYLCF